MGNLWCGWRDWRTNEKEGGNNAKLNNCECWALGTPRKFQASGFQGQDLQIMDPTPVLCLIKKSTIHYEGTFLDLKSNTFCDAIVLWKGGGSLLVGKMDPAGKGSSGLNFFGSRGLYFRGGHYLEEWMKFSHSVLSKTGRNAIDWIREGLPGSTRCSRMWVQGLSAQGGFANTCRSGVIYWSSKNYTVNLTCDWLLVEKSKKLQKMKV